MTDTVARLTAALADRYRIERELGVGGMATVYLAHDLKHDRQVAIKVLRPELAAVLGAERFVVEIKTTAALQHLHILPLFDSGTADGFLYYVMPFIQGETLRTKLDRERQLGIDEAVRITRDVADALDYAHRHGVIHRDIKPENILLQDGNAIVADFGIALAVAQAGGERLTETGLPLGTPHYMSPEQGAGERSLDARSDVYSLGCVVYEMLAGEPPYGGPSAQAILAKRFLEPLPQLSTIRQVPPGIERIIATALARVPVDRFSTAGEFSARLTEAASADGPAPASFPSQWRGARRWKGAALLAVPILLVLGLLLWNREQRQRLKVDLGLLLVFPFRVSGADPALVYLQEGMIDLMEMKLPGDAGLRTVDARTVMRLWLQAGGGTNGDPQEKTLRAIARRIGAGQVVLGSVIGTPAQLSISATLLSTRDGSTIARASVGPGLHDSLPRLVDQLAAQLLVGAAGQPHEVAAMTTFAALQPYLRGRAELRSGHWEEALRSFDQALSRDSAFVLAWVMRARACGWIVGGCQTSSNVNACGLVSAGRDRLGERDRAWVVAMCGSKFPAIRSRAQRVADADALARVAPEEPDSWLWLGEQYFHFGTYAGIPDAMDRADATFSRAFTLDSSSIEPLIHLLWLRGLKHDTGEVRRLGNRLLILDSLRYAGWVHWLGPWTIGDSAAARVQQGRFDRMSQEALLEFVNANIWNGAALENGRMALEAMHHRTLSPSESRMVELLSSIHGFGQGQPVPAPTSIQISNPGMDPSRTRLWGTVSYGLFWEGDSVAARVAAQRLAGLPTKGMDPAVPYYDQCVLGEWGLSHGDRRSAVGAIPYLGAAAPPLTLQVVADAHLCGDLLNAWAAVIAHQANAPGIVARLDSVLRTGPLGSLPEANLIDAALLVRTRDSAAALAALRRGPGYYWGVYRSTYAREEGRLAAKLGDREGAIKAYKLYLALRWNPVPALQPQVDAVRQELAKLLAEPRVGRDTNPGRM